jgi:hypothetical protein
MTTGRRQRGVAHSGAQQRTRCPPGRTGFQASLSIHYLAAHNAKLEPFV